MVSTRVSPPIPPASFHWPVPDTSAKKRDRLDCFTVVAVPGGFVQSAVTGRILAGSFEVPSCIKAYPTAFIFFNPLDSFLIREDLNNMLFLYLFQTGCALYAPCS